MFKTGLGIVIKEDIKHCLVFVENIPLEVLDLCVLRQ